MVIEAMKELCEIYFSNKTKLAKEWPPEYFNCGKEGNSKRYFRSPIKFPTSHKQPTSTALLKLIEASVKKRTLTDHVSCSRFPFSSVMRSISRLFAEGFINSLRCYVMLGKNKITLGHYEILTQQMIADIIDEFILGLYIIVESSWIVHLVQNLAFKWNLDEH